MKRFHQTLAEKLFQLVCWHLEQVSGNTLCWLWAKNVIYWNQARVCWCWFFSCIPPVGRPKVSKRCKFGCSFLHNFLDFDFVLSSGVIQRHQMISASAWCFGTCAAEVACMMYFCWTSYLKLHDFQLGLALEPPGQSCRHCLCPLIKLPLLPKLPLESSISKLSFWILITHQSLCGSPFRKRLIWRQMMSSSIKQSLAKRLTRERHLASWGSSLFSKKDFNAFTGGQHFGPVVVSRSPRRDFLTSWQVDEISRKVVSWHFYFLFCKQCQNHKCSSHLEVCFLFLCALCPIFLEVCDLWRA